MNMLCIADNADTCSGLRLAGIRGWLAQDAPAFHHALEAAKAASRGGEMLLAVSEGLAVQHARDLAAAREESGLWYVTIPDTEAKV